MRYVFRLILVGMRPRWSIVTAAFSESQLDDLYESPYNRGAVHTP